MQTFKRRGVNSAPAIKIAPHAAIVPSGTLCHAGKPSSAGLSMSKDAASRSSLVTRARPNAGLER
jgi:hypothetical protein